MLAEGAIGFHKDLAALAAFDGKMAHNNLLSLTPSFRA
jgi:hypothetical protein